jgi:hypothetical protein
MCGAKMQSVLWRMKGCEYGKKQYKLCQNPSYNEKHFQTIMNLTMFKKSSLENSCQTDIMVWQWSVHREKGWWEKINITSNETCMTLHCVHDKTNE